jgi:hypothetical protein
VQTDDKAMLALGGSHRHRVLSRRTIDSFGRPKCRKSANLLVKEMHEWHTWIDCWRVFCHYQLKQRHDREAELLETLKTEMLELAELLGKEDLDSAG